MNVVKFIGGFATGAIGLFVGCLILAFCVVYPIFFLTGLTDPPHVFVFSISGVLTVVAIYIGASFAPKVWKWGIRAGAVIPALLAVLPVLAFVF